MSETPRGNEVTDGGATDAAPSAPATPRRGPHRGADPREAIAELTLRAHEISQDAGNKMAGAMRDVINAAAGLAGFAVESARDLIQYMVRRGQMSPQEGEKLLRQAEEAAAKRPQPATDAGAERRASGNGTGPQKESTRAPKAASREPAPKVAAKAPAKAVAGSAPATATAKTAAKGGRVGAAAKAPAKSTVSKSGSRPAARSAPAKSPAKSATKAPAKASAKASAKAPAKAPAKKPVAKSARKASSVASPKKKAAPTKAAARKGGKRK